MRQFVSDIIKDLRSGLVRTWNRLTGGLPIPPPPLVFLVAGTDDVAWFLKSGRMGAESMQQVLEKHGVDARKFNSILDFGCGIGRVIRHWHDLGPALFGTDYNSTLIAWCKKHLGFADFRVNDLAGKLNYENGKFDFIYALSVFTHLAEPQQFFWMDELSRVLRDGGYLLITTHGDFYIPQIPADKVESFKRGELVVAGDTQEGSNFCAAFHPREYVLKKLARGLEVVDYIPEGAKGNPRQDLYLLRKTKAN